MSAQEYFILTAAQRAAAMAFNTAGVAVEPRAVDGVSPGAALVGKYVAPKRIVNDPEYKTRAPAMVAYLLALPTATLESDTIFAPAQARG